MDIQERLYRLEAIESICRLKAEYAELADLKYTDDHCKKEGEELASVVRAQVACFTDDVEWDAGPFGVLKGKEALYESFIGKPFSFSSHIYVNPVIDVSGDEATGRWLHWLLVSKDANAKPIHAMGYTHDRYRRVNGKWLISAMRFQLKFETEFGEHWTRAK